MPVYAKLCGAIGRKPVMLTGIGIFLLGSLLAGAAWSMPALITGGLTLVILGMLEGGEAWAWASARGIGVFVLGAICFVGFVLVERRSSDPVLPLWVFSHRLLLTTTLVSLGVGAVLIGLTSYVPTFLEGAAGTVPLVAGLAVAVQSIGWPITSSSSGWFYLRIRFRNTTVIGVAFMILGAGLLTVTTSLASPWWTALGCFVVGLGLGFSSTPAIVAAQSAVPWSRRGVVTGANMLARAVDSSVGVAVFGAIANALIARSGEGPHDPGALITSATGVFAAVLACGALTLVAASFIPRTVEQIPDRR